MNRNAWLDEFQKNVGKLVAKSPIANVERNVKAAMGSAFNKMDLVTRDEFDLQVELLKRTTERAAQLEQQIQALEHRVAQLESK